MVGVWPAATSLCTFLLIVTYIYLYRPRALSSEIVSPAKSERQPILDMFNKFFLKTRSHDDQQQKKVVREGLIERLHELGFESSFLQKSSIDWKGVPAESYNIISILPGKHRHTPQEQILLVGAHWDSAKGSPGVNDNGSGSTGLLEIARLISMHHCSFNHTVMLVWFDHEENGFYGSTFFVRDYLYPNELDKHQSKFIGAYILDMILVRDKANNTQDLSSSLSHKVPDYSAEVESENRRGDFLTTSSRKHRDEPLESAFRSAWQDLGFGNKTLKAIRPELPQISLGLSKMFEWWDFLRSDHFSFWFPPGLLSGADLPSLNAILLTDYGWWRKSYKECYHSACDDEHLLTHDNLAFMQQVIDAMVLTLLRTGGGECAK